MPDIVFLLYTEGNNNVPCESLPEVADNSTIIDNNPIPDENATDTNNDNGPSESPTSSATEMPNNTMVDNDDENNGSDVAWISASTYRTA